MQNVFYHMQTISTNFQNTLLENKRNYDLSYCYLNNYADLRKPYYRLLPDFLSYIGIVRF